MQSITNLKNKNLRMHQRCDLAIFFLTFLSQVGNWKQMSFKTCHMNFLYKLLFIFWDYYLITSFHPSTSSLQNLPCIPTCYPINSWLLFFIICFLFTYANVHILTFKHLLSCIVLPYEYVLTAEHLVLDNQLMCSSPRKSMPAAPSIP